MEETKYTCDRCGIEMTTYFGYEGDAEDGSEDEKLCRDCISRT